MLCKPIKTSPELLELLERAKHHKMTPAEKAAQRQSWVVGEMMLEHPEMTRDEAVAIYNRIILDAE